MRSGSGALQRVWSRRPAKAIARPGARELLVLSVRDLLAAAAREDLLLVALAAPAPAAIAGFVRAARDAEAPLLLVRPSGAAEEKGPQEARDDVLLWRFHPTLGVLQQLLQPLPRARKDGCAVGEEHSRERVIEKFRQRPAHQFLI